MRQRILGLAELFTHYSIGMLRWRREYLPSEPHQELIPFVALFRPLERRHLQWEIAWDEDDFPQP